MKTVKRIRSSVRNQVLLVTSRPALTMTKPANLTGDLRKACLDYPLAFAILILSLPVMGLAMLLIRMTSRGPALYSQTRLGRNGVPFTIYKLRTMCDDAEGLTGPRWSFPGDPRITPLGHILRKLHIDELPQLYNVLRGDMSLVGPRPERPEIVAGLRKVIAGYDYRLTVKPGITGMAQIHLPPDETLESVRNKLVHDRYYVQKQSFIMDLTILIFTGFKVIGLKRLYQRR